MKKRIYFKSTNRPVREKVIWSFDTEDDSRGHVKQISFYNGIHFFHFRTPPGAIEFLFNNFPRDSRQRCTYFVATNLEYDLQNIFADRMDLLDFRLRSGGTTMVSARLRGTRVYFYDTLNHSPMGVKALGDFLGLEKLPMDLTSWEYVDRDTEITWRFAVELQRRYNVIGANFNATLPSSALDLFRRHFLEFVVQQPSIEALDFMRAGYYGGRTEVFRLDPRKADQGNIFYIDINSMYPAVMCGVYPNPNMYRWKSKINYELFGMADVDVSIPDGLYFAPLPYRDEKQNGRLIFPVGRFRGIWTYGELQEMKKRGGRVRRVHRAIEFPIPCYPFKRYIEHLYPMKQRARDDVQRRAAKILMNALYGKFGERVRLTTLRHVSRVPDDTAGIMFGDMVYLEHGEKYPNHTNVIWSVHTTAQARIRLLESMERIQSEGGTILYTDTDSVIYQADRPLHIQSDELGAWKLEGEFDFAHFLGPKLYSLLDGDRRIVRAKGVPRSFAPQFFDEGSATFSRPYRLKTALRKGYRGTYWAEFTKRRRTPYTKRIILDGGETRPLKLNRK